MIVMDGYASCGGDCLPPTSISWHDHLLWFPGIAARLEGDREQHPEDAAGDSADPLQPPPRAPRQQLLRQETGRWSQVAMATAGNPLAAPIGDFAEARIGLT